MPNGNTFFPCKKLQSCSFAALHITSRRQREADAKHRRREILTALFYVVRRGCAWRLLPHDFPLWKTVYHSFLCLRIDGTMERLHAALRTEVRQKAGREPQPSGAIRDSQSVQTTSTGGERGSDGWKRVHGRQRHLLVDLMGLPLTVVVHAANIADCTGATVVLKKGNGVWTRLPWVWADGSDTGALIQWVKDPCGWVLELLTPRPGVKGFAVGPQVWVVERTFGWLGRYRRLSQDDERLTETSETMLYAAMVRLMVKRLA